MTFVIVPGAWDTPAAMEALIEPLESAGHAVIIVDLPCDDAAAMLELDRRPALIVGPTDADDVALVVAHAKERGLPLVIRAGGHSIAGHSTGDEALLLDLSAIRDVEIDAVERTTWADAGVLAGEYTSATHALGLVTPFGIPDPSALPGSRSAAACAGWCASFRRMPVSGVWRRCVPSDRRTNHNICPA